jgi:hypothetical protein
MTSIVAYFIYYENNKMVGKKGNYRKLFLK